MLKDTYLRCRTCGNSFLVTSAQRQLLAARSAPLPERCPACSALEGLAERHTGRLVRYDRSRGFGFIQDDAGGSVFVHASALGLRRGARPPVGSPLTYYVEHTERGLRAVAVRVSDQPLLPGAPSD
ncbi:MAG: cold shock domain-containing protein [Chloroflexi bacterium]|nr:cold shock domain-containing protein [Chloroflexota bacterium]